MKFEKNIVRREGERKENFAIRERFHAVPSKTNIFSKCIRVQRMSEIVIEAK